LDKNQYLQKFKDLGLQTWRIRQVDQTWYKQRFEWKIEFNFSTQDKSYGRYMVDHRWVQLLRECEVLNFEFRKRREVWTTIYTSDSNLINHILDREEYRTAIVSLEYTNDLYIKERGNQTQLEAVTDIKYVKHPTEFCYHVYLGNFEWEDNSVKQPLTEYLAANSNDFLFKGYYQEVIDRCKKHVDLRDYSGRYRGVYDGFNFFAKNTDDILMLHMIAPGKIRKIIKLMEKVN
jgi:hypothetical protein